MTSVPTRQTSNHRTLIIVFCSRFNTHSPQHRQRVWAPVASDDGPQCGIIVDIRNGVAYPGRRVAEEVMHTHSIPSVTYFAQSATALTA